MLARTRPFTSFAGLDLGGGKGKKTSLAVLEQHGEGADLQVRLTRLYPRQGEPPLYDRTLVAILRGLGPDCLLCVDAPLTLPPCLRCQVPVCPGQEACVDPAVLALRAVAGKVADPSRDLRRGKPVVTPYTQRVTEIFMYRKMGVLPRETMGQGTGPLTARALHLCRSIADVFRLNENLIEVFPKATLASFVDRLPAGVNALHGRYRKRVDIRLALLERFGHLAFSPPIWREECVQSDHAFDAVVCAYSGFLAQSQNWTIPPELAEVAATDGWIWTANLPEAGASGEKKKP